MKLVDGPFIISYPEFAFEEKDGSKVYTGSLNEEIASRKLAKKRVAELLKIYPPIYVNVERSVYIIIND